MAKYIIPRYIERISVPFDESVAFDLEVGKHTEQDSLAIVELTEELPFSIANTHKDERNDFPVSEFIMPSPSPVPDVAPQYSVQQIKCFLRASVPVVISPSGNNRVQVSD